MKYDLPQLRLILDLVAAVLLTVRSSSSSLYIQAQPAFYSCLATHLSRKIAAKTVRSNHRHSLGLPLFFRFRAASSATAALATIAILILALALLRSMPAVPYPDVIRPPDNLIAVVTDIGGRVERSYVSRGMSVRVGDPIIQLEVRQLLVEKRRLESQIHEAELHKPEHDSELAGLYRGLLETQERMNQQTIVSPANGEIVAVRQVEKHDILTSGTVIALVALRAIAADEKRNHPAQQ